MAEMVERVAKLEERTDAVTSSITELRSAIRDLDTRMLAGFTEVRSEMHTQFRWVMGGIGGATLAILLAVVAAILSKG
jgi:chromosome segregation ATPase